MLRTPCLVLGLALSLAAGVLAAQDNTPDWPGWLGGPGRPAGTATADTPLLRSLPESGLKPVWLVDDDELTAGGWSSPVVAEGRLVLYSNGLETRADADLPPAEYPALTPEQIATMPADEKREYVAKQTAERIERQRQTQDATDEIRCFSAETGERLWSASFPTLPNKYRQSSTPAIAGGRVHVLGADAVLRSFDLADGRLVWERRVEHDLGDGVSISSSPVVVAGKVVVAAGRLFAFDAETGEPHWQGEVHHPEAIYSTPAVWRPGGRELLLANFPKTGTVCLDAVDGRELWQERSFALRSTPVVAGDRLVTYANSRKKGLRCYRLPAGDPESKPELLWSYHRVTDIGSTPVVAAGRVFVQGDRTLAALDLETGKAVWSGKLDLAKPQNTSPIAVDFPGGTHVFYAYEGITTFDAEADRPAPLYSAVLNRSGLLAEKSDHLRRLGVPEGELPDETFWKEQITNYGPRGSTTPAFAAGRLFVRIGRGIACYDLSAEARIAEGR